MSCISSASSQTRKEGVTRGDGEAPVEIGSRESRMWAISSRVPPSWCSQGGSESIWESSAVSSSSARRMYSCLANLHKRQVLCGGRLPRHRRHVPTGSVDPTRSCVVLFPAGMTRINSAVLAPTTVRTADSMLE